MLSEKRAKYNGCLQAAGIPLLIGGLISLLAGVFFLLTTAGVAATGAAASSEPATTQKQKEELAARQTGSAVIGGAFGIGGVGFLACGVIGLFAGGSLSLSKRHVWKCPRCGSEAPKTL